MANKTIIDLTELTDPIPSQSFVPLDNGTQTFKVKLSNLLGKKSYVSPTSGNVFLTSDTPDEIFLSSPIAQVDTYLPSAGVVKGRKFKFRILGATATNSFRLFSSGGNVVERIEGIGVVEVQALQNNPTSAGHWDVIDVYEEIQHATQWIFTGGTAFNGTSQFIHLIRRNKVVTAGIPKVVGTTPAGSVTNLSNVNAIPSRFKGGYTGHNGIVMPIGIIVNNVMQAAPGKLVYTHFLGQFVITLTLQSGAFAASTALTGTDNVAVTYTI